MTSYYFDTSAFSRFNDLTDAQLDSLSSRLKDRGDVLVISEVLLSELVPPAHASGRLEILRRQLGFIEKCPVEMPLSLKECTLAESVGGSTVCSELDLKTCLHNALYDPQLSNIVREHNRVSSLQWILGETNVRKELPIDYPGRVNRDMSDWVRHVHEGTEYFCKKAMEAHSDELELPADRSTSRDPRALPTLWAYWGWYYAHSCVSLQNGSKIDPNDGTDQDHFVAAAHSDVFVTNDTRLQRKVRLCPAPKPQLMDFDGWIGQVTSC